MNIPLTDDLEQYVALEIASGRYASATEVIRTALMALQALRFEQRLIDAETEIDQGGGVPLNQAFFAETRSWLDDQLKK
jgi:putative addiction module CopG family antidote